MSAWVLSQPDLTDLVSLFFLLCMPLRRLAVGFGNSATSLLLFKRILFFFIYCFPFHRVTIMWLKAPQSSFLHLYAVDMFGPVTTLLLWDNYLKVIMWF